MGSAPRRSCACAVRPDPTATAAGAVWSLLIRRPSRRPRPRRAVSSSRPSAPSSLASAATLQHLAMYALVVVLAWYVSGGRTAPSPVASSSSSSPVVLAPSPTFCARRDPIVCAHGTVGSADWPRSMGRRPFPNTVPALAAGELTEILVSEGQVIPNDYVVARMKPVTAIEGATKKCSQHASEASSYEWLVLMG